MLPEGREAVLDLLSQQAGVRPAIVTEEHLGHEWDPAARLTFDREPPALERHPALRSSRLQWD